MLFRYDELKKEFEDRQPVVVSSDGKKCSYVKPGFPIEKLYAGGGITLDPAGGRRPHDIQRHDVSNFWWWFWSASLCGVMIWAAFRADDIRMWVDRVLR